MCHNCFTSLVIVALFAQAFYLPGFAGINEVLYFLAGGSGNKRLQILTIVSAIFLPLMLVTGIYGMNFRHMPELSWRYGYPAALLLMGVVTLGLLWVLARKGWFK